MDLEDDVDFEKILLTDVRDSIIRHVSSDQVITKYNLNLNLN